MEYINFVFAINVVFSRTGVSRLAVAAVGRHSVHAPAAISTRHGVTLVYFRLAVVSGITRSAVTPVEIDVIVTRAAILTRVRLALVNVKLAIRPEIARFTLASVEIYLKQMKYSFTYYC